MTPFENKDNEAPIVVAYLYNTNGMATWCWEAAHALHELGHEVILCVSTETTLPGVPKVRILHIDKQSEPPGPTGFYGKGSSLLRRSLSTKPDGVLGRIHLQLATQQVIPSCYVLNQSTLVDRRVDCKQLVASWSYPVDLVSYLKKTITLAPNKSAEAIFRTGLDAAGWWRKDWRGMREADCVLSVTSRLNTILRSRGVRSNVVYPGTNVPPLVRRTNSGIRMLVAAESLNAPRKRILWMLEAVKRVNPQSGLVLQLAGGADDEVRHAASQCGLPFEFLGKLRREEFQSVMQQADIFCFGSILDDYGYVLVEAMANGLVPVAPKLAPFDEIVGDAGSCYEATNQDSFAHTVNSAISGLSEGTRFRTWQRASEIFSRRSFGQSILNSMKSASL